MESDQAKAVTLHEVPSSEGLEALPIEHLQQPLSAPEAFGGPEKEAVNLVERPQDSDKEFDPPSKIGRPPFLPWIKRRRWLFILLVAIILVVVVVAVAVPLAAKKKGKDSNQAPAKNATGAASDSTTPPGALAGTRLTTFDVDLNNNTNVHIFYQDNALQIRRVQKVGRQWSGGPNLPIVIASQDARNATPLACVNYTDPATNISTAHLFYANQSNFLQEMISTDNLTTWHPGPLGNSSFQASPSATAMVAMWSVQYFGHVKANSSGIRLFYGGPDNQVQELAFALGDSSWVSQSTLNGTNGNAGITATSIDSNYNGMHLYTVDMNNNFRVWNLNTGKKPDSSVGFYGNWTEVAKFGGIDLAPNSSLAYAQGWLSYQLSSNAISAMQTYPQSTSVWGSTMAVGGSLGLQYARQGSAVMAASVWQGEDQQNPYSLDIWWQGNSIGNGTGHDAVAPVVECLDIDNQYTTTTLPLS